MTSLRDFIAARLDEAQNDAETRNTAAFIHETGCYYYNNQYDPAYCDCDGPEHALREVAAKRAIIELADDATGLDMSVDNDRLVGSRAQGEDPYIGDLILRQLAQVYSDHADFNPEWSTE